MNGVITKEAVEKLSDYEKKALLTKKAEQMTVKQAELRFAKERYEKHQNEFNELSSEENDISNEIAKPYLEEDKELFAQIKADRKALQDSTSSSMQSYVLKVFRTVFKNMSSRTRIVEVPDIFKYGKLTIGKVGFGYRHNVKSEQIYSIEQVASVVKSKSAICAWMKKNRLAKWVPKLDKFADIFPAETIGKWGKVEFSYKLPEEIPFRDYSSTYQGIELSVTESAMLRIRSKTGGGGVDIIREPYSYYDSEKELNFVCKQPYVYVKIRKYLPEMAEQFHEIATDAVERFTNVDEKLRQAFGRELILSAT